MDYNYCHHPLCIPDFGPNLKLNKMDFARLNSYWLIG